MNFGLSCTADLDTLYEQTLDPDAVEDGTEVVFHPAAVLAEMVALRQVEATPDIVAYVNASDVASIETYDL